MLTRSNALVYAGSATGGGVLKPFGERPFKHEKLGVKLGEDALIAPWGTDNLKPMRWIKLLSESNIAPQLLQTKVDFACGERVFTYIEELKRDEVSDELKVVRIPYETPELKRWLYRNKIQETIRKRATDYYFSGNCMSTLVPARDPERFGIVFIDHLDSMFARAECINNNRRPIEHYYICDDWQHPYYDPNNKAKNNVVRYKAWQERDPLKYKRSVQHSKIYWPGQLYYGVQPWHAAENWIGFANKIPVWMDSNITNSYNIKYHIEYPDYYFDYCKDWDDDKRKAEEDRVFDQMDRWLAGEKNVSKTFFSRTIKDRMTGNMLSGWKISPIKNDLQDKAWLDNYKTSQGAMTSGWGINPALADIPSEGKFATSGSELRIAYQIHIALKVQAARAIMFEPYEKAYKVNNDLGVMGFENPEIKFGVINRNVVTLAESKSGMENTNPSNPV